MDVSVIIPTHNKVVDLGRCLEAVLGQQLDGSFEVLVCDDGSTDETGERMEAWSSSEPRLRYFRQPNRGPAAARNLGIRHARAPLVAMIDDDTIPDPGWLRKLVEAARRPGAVAAEGRVTPGRPLSPAETAPVNDAGGVYLTCNLACRRDALLEVGGFDERFPYAAFEDCDLAAKLGEHGEIVWAPEAVVVHPPRALTWRATVRRLRHWPWVLVTGRRYGYLGWPRYPTRHPRARVLWSALVALPAGRFLEAVRGRSLRVALWAAAEPFLALVRAVPEILAVDLESTALQMDYLNLSERLPPLGVVIVHYKQPELLVRCVESLRSSDYPALRIIVVDSASESASLDRLQVRLPEVEWIACADNVGYTGGNNLGLARAMEAGCEQILLLNADTECIAPDFLRRLARFLERNPRVALAGPRVYLRGRSEVQNTILHYPSVYRNLLDWVGYRLFPQRYQRSGDRVRAAEMLNGVCVMLRASAVRQVGAFDPRFFMYVEDADLGLRLRRAGWQVAYVPIDSIVHHQKDEGYDLYGEVSLMIRRNAVYFLRKHGRRAQAWGLAGGNLILALFRTCATASFGEFRRRLAFLQALRRELRLALEGRP
jgi:N-acetylglucosaminyl-diphospho-decaprenol L-rhamnosyltransferase